MAAAAPFFREFDPASRGVRLVQPEINFAHPLDGGRAALSCRSLEETAARLGVGRRRPTAGCSSRWSSTAPTSSTSS